MRNAGALVGGLMLLLLVALNNPVAVVTLINPFIQDMKEVETRVRPIDFTEIDAASKEAQSVRLTGKLPQVQTGSGSSIMVTAPAPR